MTNEEEIAKLESTSTGDMLADVDLKRQIHKLKLDEAPRLMVPSVKSVKVKFLKTDN